MYTYEQKKAIYKSYLERGEPWFALDKSLEPTAEERKVILEMRQQEVEKIKSRIELEKRAKRLSDKELVEQVKDVRAKYGSRGLFSDRIIDLLDNY